MSASIAPKMKYRFLGNSGLYVSAFSFGGMTFDGSFGTRVDVDRAYTIMQHAFKHGINYFDNAEIYGNGQSEIVMGKVIQRGIDDKVWERSDLVVSTKIFFGSKGFGKGGPNDIGLSRKHIVEGTKAALKRLGLDYVDLIFCHRPDPCTPIEETVRAMNFVIEQGWAFYWGTSEWSAAQIIEACDIADRLGLIRPIMDQAQYNILERSRVDYEYVTLYKKYGYGLTTWSPLYSGILSGKYKNGIPENSRLADPMSKSFMPDMDEKIAKANQLEHIAKEVGCSFAQLSLAWCVSNEHVSTVILGATKLEQLDENLKALEFVDKITPEVKEKIDAIVKFQPVILPDADASVHAARKQFQ